MKYGRFCFRRYYMLLDELAPEEKKAFWIIANVLASVDGRVLEEESVLKQYNDEMGTGFAFVDPSEIDVRNELENISSGSLRSRRIVYFELFGVAYADTELDVRERKILDDVSSVLDIGDEVRKTLEESVKTVYDTYRKLGDVLNV